MPIPLDRRSWNPRRGRIPVGLCAALFVIASAGIAASRHAPPIRPAIEPEPEHSTGVLVPNRPLRTISNPDASVVWAEYCAGCHGNSGRGDGPVSGCLNSSPPDLTQIALREGTFDRLHVAAMIENENQQTGKTMPCWGRLLRTGTHRQANQLLIRNLVRHIERLQETRVATK